MRQLIKEYILCIVLQTLTPKRGIDFLVDIGSLRSIQENIIQLEKRR
jgi:hypothetical protein